MSPDERQAIKEDLRKKCLEAATAYMTSLRGIHLLYKAKIVAPKGKMLIRLTGRKPGKKQQHFEITIKEKR